MTVRAIIPHCRDTGLTIKLCHLRRFQWLGSIPYSQPPIMVASLANSSRRSLEGNGPVRATTPFPNSGTVAATH